MGNQRNSEELRSRLIRNAFFFKTTILYSVYDMKLKKEKLKKKLLLPESYTATEVTE